MRINQIGFKPLQKTSSDVPKRSDVNFRMRCMAGEPLELIMLQLTMDMRVLADRNLNARLRLPLDTCQVERDKIIAQRLKNAKIADLIKALGLPEETTIQQLYKEVQEIGTSYLDSNIRIPTLRRALDMPEDTKPKSLFIRFRKILVDNGLHGLIGDNF